MTLFSVIYNMKTIVSESWKLNLSPASFEMKTANIIWDVILDMSRVMSLLMQQTYCQGTDASLSD